MTTKTTERDLIEEVEELNEWAILAMPPSPLWSEKSTFDGAKRIDELLHRLVERDKRNRDALKMMVELWDAEHPDDPCGCVGASDDCKCPPTCELCVARMLMEGRDPADA